ncbi:MAG: LysR family transcriptional regulator [Holophaga sp.]|nr:LysR family transcriptional regulator [Holophaga sp.]
MNTRFLETFVTLSQLRNFHATARALNATPAAISLRIKSLEDELRTELVDRSAKGFRLSPNGEHLLGFAKTVVAAAAKLQYAAMEDHPVRGRVRLGVIETVVHSWLAQFMKQLAADYPELEIDLAVDMSSVLQKRLLAGELDLVVRVEGIDHPEVLSTALALYPVQWLARKGLLSARPRGLARRVLHYPILTFAQGTQPQLALVELISAMASEEDIPMEQIRLTCSPSVAAIVQLTKDGYGIAAIPSLIVKDSLLSGEIVELPVRPQPPPFMVAMCYRSDAKAMVHATAGTIRKACLKYGNSTGKEFVRMLC